MKNLLSWFRDEEGQGMVEYGLLVGLISIVAIIALIALGPRIRNMFEKADNALESAEVAGN